MRWAGCSARWRASRRRRTDQETLARSIRQLDELFLLVVVGEFNAGKSAFINALLGQRVLEEGVTPTTTPHPRCSSTGPSVAHAVADAASVDVITAPVELLRDIHIVDTPGTNAILREHEAITREFVPRSDLVLFVTSADRPFTESERAFLEAIRDWGKKIVVVINKIDILETAEDVRAACARSSPRTRRRCSASRPRSSRCRRAAGAAGQDCRRHAGRLAPASRFAALERYIVDDPGREGARAPEAAEPARRRRST